MTNDAIIDAVDEAYLPLVEVTGGEPLLQRNVYPFDGASTPAGSSGLARNKWCDIG